MGLIPGNLLVFNSGGHDSWVQKSTLNLFNNWVETEEATKWIPKNHTHFFGSIIKLGTYQLRCRINPFLTGTTRIFQYGNQGAKSIMQIRNIIGLAAFLGCGSPIAAQDYTNKLTPDESNAGYELLFNGTDLSNWHAYGGGEVSSVWRVRTNAPLGVRIENMQGTQQYILTNQKFKNFDFKADVQTPANGNSGIFFRYEEEAVSPFDFRSGPEFQICGPNAAQNDCTPGFFSFGACYNMFAPSSSNWSNPPGQWNQIRVIAFDSNYVHYGNGKKLLEYKIGTKEFEDAYGKSKYVRDGNNGRYYDIHSGGIMLQHHGEYGITFRNMKAKELDVHPLKREFPNGRWPDTLGQDMAFGRPAVSTNPSPQESMSRFVSVQAGPRHTHVKVRMKHEEFKALGLDGRPIEFRVEGDGDYLLERKSSSPNVVVIRISTKGRRMYKVVRLL